MKASKRWGIFEEFQSTHGVSLHLPFNAPVCVDHILVQLRLEYMGLIKRLAERVSLMRMMLLRPFHAVAPMRVSVGHDPAIEGHSGVRSLWLPLCTDPHSLLNAFRSSTNAFRTTSARHIPWTQAIRLQSTIVQCWEQHFQYTTNLIYCCLDCRIPRPIVWLTGWYSIDVNILTEIGPLSPIRNNYRRRFFLTFKMTR